MWTFDTALEDDFVTVLGRDDEAGTFEFRIGTLETVVTVELGRFMESNMTKFVRSHAIKTPQQMGPYIPSKTFEDHPVVALRTAISSLTQYYRAAVRAGYEPHEGWLAAI